VRYIGLHKDLELRDIQIEYFVDLMSKCENKKELKIFIESIMSPSELAYISQRLHIIKLVLDDKSYSEIKDSTGTTSGTINATKILMKSVNKRILKTISGCKIKEKANKKKKIDKNENNFIKPHYPGAIKLG